MEIPVCDIRFVNGRFIIYPSKLQIIYQRKNGNQTIEIDMARVEGIEIFEPMLGVGYMHISIDGDMHYRRKILQAKRQATCLFIRTRKQYYQAVNAKEIIEIILKEGQGIHPISTQHALAVSEQVKHLFQSKCRKATYAIKLNSLLIPSVGAIVGILMTGNASTIELGVTCGIITLSWIIILFIFLSMIRDRATSQSWWDARREKMMQRVNQVQTLLGGVTLLTLIMS
ncbi:hypothetical protein [Thermoflavimicrobium daqui]|uniref:Uncharacterized protein n=1 Tax=Thermoflavimicrobium daqui TaxID=2137476 RepID=A0A364K8T0_9BACL|nr:hypothetical protein [Thermoflavimicrobium daqui]RAL26703.1 hypothetical protein DL897_01235 [Thermoflavimicrobium daqui]